MNIDKDQILQLVSSQGKNEQASQAGNELPDPTSAMRSSGRRSRHRAGPALGAVLRRRDRSTPAGRRRPAAGPPRPQQLRILQWATPVLTGALIVLGVQQGEQQ